MTKYCDGVQIIEAIDNEINNSARSREVHWNLGGAARHPLPPPSGAGHSFRDPAAVVSACVRTFLRNCCILMTSGPPPPPPSPPPPPPCLAAFNGPEESWHVLAAGCSSASHSCAFQAQRCARGISGVLQDAPAPRTPSCVSVPRRSPGPSPMTSLLCE